MKEDCNICLNPRRRGIDKFILENKYGILVLNQNNILKLKNNIFFVKERYSFAIHEHNKSISPIIEKKIKYHLINYFSLYHNLTIKKDYYFFITMNTIPNHWHIHICLFPFKYIKKVSPKLTPPTQH